MSPATTIVATPFDWSIVFILTAMFTVLAALVVGVLAGVVYMFVTWPWLLIPVALASVLSFLFASLAAEAGV